jgi:hypothetical protein
LQKQQRGQEQGAACGQHGVCGAKKMDDQMGRHLRLT